MRAFIRFADRLSAAFGHAFGWLVVLMTLGVSYEVLVRYAFNAPTPGRSTCPSSCMARSS